MVDAFATFNGELRVAGDFTTAGGKISAYLATWNCTFPYHGDPVCDSTANVQDVVETIDIFFRGTAPTFDSHCPRQRSDVDCHGFTTAADIVKMVNVVFAGANRQTEWCHA